MLALSDFISAAITELEEGLSYLASLGYHNDPGDEARMIGILSDLFQLLYGLDNPDGTRDEYSKALQRAKTRWLALICPIESDGRKNPSISDILVHPEEKS